jgi:SAM-dependent methyltransferase
MSEIDPETYEAWFKKPVGSYADEAEKKLIATFLRTKPGDRLLDAGCGPGHFSAALLERVASVVALDVSFEMLEYARLKYRIYELVLGDVETLPFLADSFDTIMMITVLEFLKDPQRALAEICRALRPSGQVVVGVLNRRSPWGILRRIRGLLGDVFWGKARLYSRDEMVDLLIQAGYAGVESQSILFGSFILLRGYKPSALIPQGTYELAP